MERGEVHGTWANWSTLKAIAEQWIEEKKIRILVQWALRKHPELPDVPLILELAKTDGAEAGAASWRWRGSNSAGRSSCRRTCRPTASNAIRRAFDATMKDQEFLAEADKLKIEVDPLTGEQVAALIVRDLQDAGRRRSNACARRWRRSDAIACHTPLSFRDARSAARMSRRHCVDPSSRAFGAPGMTRAFNSAALSAAA